MKHSHAGEVDQAIAEVASGLIPGIDRDYFEGCKLRFRRTACRILEIFPRKSRLLDIGSHFMHLGAILSCLGYEIWGVDVPVFHEIEWVPERQRRYNIIPVPVARIDEDKFLADRSQCFKGVLFCDIMEHITFNPIRFWTRIHDLLEIGGMIYVTTPNGLMAMNILSAIKRIVLLEGMGPTVQDILGSVTYGHHWKEYSKKEMIQYFSSLSTDFDISVNYYSFRIHAHNEFADYGRNLVRRIGNLCRIYAEELEVIIRKTANSGMRMVPPTYLDNTTACP